MSRKLVMEFLGTFFLALFVFSVSNVLQPTSHFGVGLMLMILVYAGGHISGAHYNPAISWSIFIRRGVNFSHFIAYFGAQLLGALLAGFLCFHFIAVPSFSNLLELLNMNQELALLSPLMKNLGLLAEPILSLEFFLKESLFTFFFTFVVLQVATCPKNQPNSFYGLSIGLSLTVISFLHPLMLVNPALTLWKLTESFLTSSDTILFYLVALGAQFLGASLSGLLYHFLCCEDCQNCCPPNNPHCCVEEKKS